MKSLYFLFVVIVFISCSKDKETSTLESITIPSVSTPNDKSFGVETPMVSVEGGKYIPLYGGKNKEVEVNNLLIDVYPVSSENFLAFVKQNKRWRKSQIKKLFADGNYLNNWKNDTILPSDVKPNSPITNVSWYAANSYCECQGKRLATVDEWEFVAMANENVADARKIEEYNQYILDWYEKPKTFNNEIGKTFKNYYGVYDLHGLVWEWTSDFNSILLTGESRSDVTTDKNLFCGSGSLNASDLMNYAAFIRYAFRGSIKANYAVKNLGFRCVKDTINTKKP